MPVPHPPKVLLIGWDAADWRLARPLIDRGELPSLAGLMAAGVHGHLRTLQPMLSPMLWTSIATGKRAWKHGIHGFSEPTPDGQGIRPVSVLSRRAKAVWNILNQNGYRCNIAGWWPSHPAEPVAGAMISNRYHPATVPPGAPWPVPAGSVHPEHLAARLAELRIHPSELEAAHLLPFIPRAAEIDQSTDTRLIGLAHILADAVNVHAAATALVENEPADFMAVYYDALDHFGHAFMRFHPPRLPWVDPRDFALFSGVIEAAYKFHDMLLGRWLDLVGPDCAVLLLSDHGFHPDHQRRPSLPIDAGGPAAEHGQHGIFVLRAQGVAPGRRLAGATLLDIAPTLLHLFDLPAGRDMDGRVLAEIFTDPCQPLYVDSWETLQGPHPDGSHPPETLWDGAGDEAALRQLAALGYLDPPTCDPGAARAAQDELDFNLALACLDGGRPADALPRFQSLWDRHPTHPRFGLGVVRCHLALEHPSEARLAFELVRQRKHRDASQAASELAAQPGPPTAPTELETQLRARLHARAHTHTTNLLRIEALLLRAEGRFREALDLLSHPEARGSSPGPAYHLLHAELLLDLKDFGPAELEFRKTSELDPLHAEARLGLARCCLSRRRILEAAAFALEATELRPHFPAAHYVLGVALHRLGRLDYAEKALRMTLAQNPHHADAHRRLAHLYGHRLRHPDLARHHLAAAAAARRHLRRTRARHGLPSAQSTSTPEPNPTPSTASPAILLSRPAPKGRFRDTRLDQIVTVVSGLPRAGTSLVMQMLNAGGLPPLTDGTRQADDSNPRGYLEFERTRDLARDASWIHQARGRAVKIVAPLLTSLPASQQYRVLFIERDLDEILDSQAAMLRRQNLPPAADPDAIRFSYLRLLAQVTAWMEHRRDMDTLFLRHSDLLRNPAGEVDRIRSFLGAHLDAGRMIAAIDPALHRSRGNVHGTP
ncbi:MAG: alkaline phosphatase family protein [Verrucomicrobiae bacterium]|nr:alkaline phosphatase family protein [Verrucomicrobiae bacterium]